MYNLRRYVLIVSVLVVVMTSSTMAQGQPKSTGAQSEIRSFKITNRDEDAERYNFEVEYTYSGERGKTVYVSAFPLFRDRKRAPDIVCGQGEVEAGSGSVSGTIWSKWSAYPATSTQVRVCFNSYSGGNDRDFGCKIFEASTKWSGSDATDDSAVAGPKPRQFADGRVPAVIRYLEENLNDPYTMKLIRWSKIRIVYLHDERYWYVEVRMRVKNAFGAYILKEAGFYLRHDKVVRTADL